MMALLWSDIGADLASAKRHFAEAIALYRGPLARGSGGYVEIMAFQHAMQAGYTSFETGMRRLLTMLGEPLPVGPDHHAALVRRLSQAIEGQRPALLASPLHDRIEDLRRFRHVAMHAYDDFAVERAVLPVEAAEAFLTGIDAALERFRASLDPD